ncbi:MAG: type II toxin-antitoxin system HicB family antitoxin [Bacteroidales bacterium]|nr:type II toxin-antitoxin system HicB family antitoxin [Bacteroidales bacterium]
MHHLKAVIEYSGRNFAAYIENLRNVISVGDTIDETKKNLKDAVDFYIESSKLDGDEIPEELKGEYDILLKMDVKSFLTFYSGIFTKSALERLTGINQKQLWHYAKGKSVPRRKQVQKIEDALHRLGRELNSLTF